MFPPISPDFCHRELSLPARVPAADPPPSITRPPDLFPFLPLRSHPMTAHLPVPPPSPLPDPLMPGAPLLPLPPAGFCPAHARAATGEPPPLLPAPAPTPVATGFLLSIPHPILLCLSSLPEGRRCNGDARWPPVPPSPPYELPELTASKPQGRPAPAPSAGQVRGRGDVSIWDGGAGNSHDCTSSYSPHRRPLDLGWRSRGDPCVIVVPLLIRG
jgi:hypothetical protein